jgi:hypothetical protein
MTKKKEYKKRRFIPYLKSKFKKYSNYSITKIDTIKIIIIEKKLIKKSIITLALLLIIFIILISILNIQFIIKEKLIVRANPIDLTLNLEQNETKEVIINVSMTNFFLCYANCTEKIIDISKGKIVENNIIKKDSKKTFQRNFNITTPHEGIGILKYRYEIKCINEKTFFCPATEDISVATTFITLNYDQNEEKKELKDNLKNKILITKELINQTHNYSLIQQNYINSLDNKLFLNLITKANEQITKQKNYLIELNDIINKWNSENYNFDNKIKVLINNLNYLKNEQEENIKNLSININKYNEFVNFTNNINNFQFKEIYYFNDVLYNQRNNSRFNNLIINHLNNIKTINEKLSKDIFELNLINEAYINHKKIIENYNLDKKTFYNDTLFILNSNLIQFIDFKKNNFYYNHSNILIEILNSNQKEDNNDLCYSLNKLVNIIEKHNNNSLLLNTQLNNKIIDNITIDNTTQINFTNELNIFKIKYYNQIYEIQNNYSSVLNILKNISYNDTNQNNSFNIFFPYITLNNTPELLILKNNLCKIENFNLNDYPSILDYDFSINNITLKQVNYTKQNITLLQELKEICCFNSICEKCYPKNKTKENYPILFIHGHSFNKQDTPEFSMNSLNELMTALEDLGFINTGQLDLTNQNNINDDWAKFNKPVITKATFYYITYVDLGINLIQVHKSEKIENYALRLNEIINILLAKTNKDKVIIVSHSMGGLVSREYISIFGDEKINKLIMIGTPNHGVSGKIKTNCAITGAKKECEDLAENSIFLRRLNNNPMPKNTKFYTISGIGCVMDNNLDGDGIVTLNSSILPNAKSYIINGTCRDIFKTSLHGDLLKPSLYPQTVEILKEILLE